MKRVVRRALVFVALPVLVLAFLLWWAGHPMGSRVRVTISKETTFITEPLRKDGYPDYVAWLNQRCSKGVTPENNAAVPFWKALGPGDIPKENRDRHFRMLGIPQLPEKGDYFRTSEVHCNAEVARRQEKEHLDGEQAEKLRDRLNEQLSSIQERPWSKQKYPVWADWLAANEKPLALLIEASKRPRRYDPMIGGDQGCVIGILLPGPQASRDVARALVARAMLRTGDGRLDDAWQDLLACHRLARLEGQGFSLVEALVAIALDGVARAGDQRLLEDGRLTPAQIAAMRSDLAKLPPMPNIADLVDTSERCGFLDIVASVARDGTSGLTAITGSEIQGVLATIESAFLWIVDWDTVLRMDNSWFDRLVEAARQPTRDKRVAAMAAINKDLKDMATAVRARKSLGLAIFAGPRRVTEHVGQALIMFLLPATECCVTTTDRSLMESDLLRLAFALAAYRADHGSYPAKLADLTPGYLKQVPKDIFAHDADLHYRRDKDGCLLYSVGVNGKDDGGKSLKDGNDYDDLVIRLRPRNAPTASPVKPHVRVTISKETTYITEPLRKDGYPDYIAWLNRKYSQGVTPENNAAVLFWKAVGPGDISKENRDRHFRMLGIPPLPEKGDYFRTSEAQCSAEVARRQEKEHLDGEQAEKLRSRLEEQLDSVMERPWSKKEFPLWADWLAANEKPLALLIEASKRPRRYDPMIGGDPGWVISILTPGAQASRDVARALAARAMLRANDGKLDDAWQDLLACHRLARLEGNGFSFIEALVAITLDNTALVCDQRLLEDDRLSPVQIAAMRADFARLPPMPKAADLFDVGERCCFLDCTAIVARDGWNSLLALVGSGDPRKEETPSLESAVLAAVHWDTVLRMDNSWFDRLVEAAHQSTRDKRAAAVAELDRDLKEMGKRVRDGKSFCLDILNGPRQALTEWVGQALIAILLPATDCFIRAEDRWLMETDLLRLAFALAAYRADHGTYPAKLAELTPGYLKQVPKDIFAHDADLHYRRDKDGCLLYSVGVDGKDDGGKSLKDGDDHDDLVIRLRPRNAPRRPSASSTKSLPWNSSRHCNSGAFFGGGDFLEHELGLADSWRDDFCAAAAGMFSASKASEER